MAAPLPALAQAGAPAPAAPPAAQPSAAPAAETYSAPQLDALLAPIALYPDTLLTQILMASTQPVQVVQALRWLDNPANKALTGDALAKAMESQSWDPSVKSLVPFPAVLQMMSDKADWMEQLGYAFSVQQGDVLDSVQRLRRQAQEAGNLQSTPQQTVTMTQTASAPPGAPAPIVIEPTDPQVVYVPSYNPTQVYGSWPYPDYPPVYIPPPPGYGFGTALVTGMAFAAGAAVVGSLWNVGRPVWGYGGGYGAGHVNVNVNRWNSVNVNRAQINNPNWRAPGGAGYSRAGGPGGAGRPIRPPGNGPVGAPRSAGVPAGAIGRPSVKVPASAVDRPGRPGQTGGTRANLPGGPGANRPNPPSGGPANRPNLPGGGGGARPSPPAGAPARPANISKPAGIQRPAAPAAPARQPPAFSGMKDGNRAQAYSNRGAQSRQVGAAHANRGGGGGGMQRGGGDGGGRRH